MCVWAQPGPSAFLQHLQHCNPFLQIKIMFSILQSREKLVNRFNNLLYLSGSAICELGRMSYIQMKSDKLTFWGQHWGPALAQADQDRQQEHGKDILGRSHGNGPVSFSAVGGATPVPSKKPYWCSPGTTVSLEPLPSPLRAKQSSDVQ